MVLTEIKKIIGKKFSFEFVYNGHLFVEVNKNKNAFQEDAYCPLATVQVVFLTETPLDREPLARDPPETPLHRDPLDRDPWTETPMSCDLWGMLEQRSPEQNDTQV